MCMHNSVHNVSMLTTDGIYRMQWGSGDEVIGHIKYDGEDTSYKQVTWPSYCPVPAIPILKE